MHAEEKYINAVAEKWLKQQLKIKGKKIKDILLMTLDENEKINIYLK